MFTGRGAVVRRVGSGASWGGSAVRDRASSEVGAGLVKVASRPRAITITVDRTRWCLQEGTVSVTLTSEQIKITSLLGAAAAEPSEPTTAEPGESTATAPDEVADRIIWERRDARLVDHRDGSVVFEQTGTEVPASWSQSATNILAQKYFRGALGTSERESSLRQVVGRIVGTITDWGRGDGYFADAAAAAGFQAGLSDLLYTQKAAFNSPVWFNIGVRDVPQQASACFILSVQDTMESILTWYTEEGRIFKGGSGAGVNLSRLRASCEPLGGGGTASGPVSFMRGADASAGTIKSGGKTRRAAKMVVLNADHPDIEEFIWCKAREERKSRALASAGFDMSLNGVDAASVQYQNANNSVRVTDEFMQAAVKNHNWDLTARVDGRVVRTVSARALLRQIAESAWECADPGLQFHSTINRWHTAAATGPITASNPCSEYIHLDNSACNLASINLLKFLGDDGVFDVDGFRRAVRLVFIAQEILVGHADYPTEAIMRTTHDFRQLGLGYANLGAMLMALGLPYDSDEGRAMAAAVTALLTGEAYLTSSRMAESMGPFAGFDANRDHMLRVLEQHRAAVGAIDESLAPAEVLQTARTVWDEACERAAVHGVRNSQATVLAPTGTIGLLMDCDTTGIEPDLGLVKSKRLVGGGTMEITNQTLPRALDQLGYSGEQSAQIIEHVAEHHTVDRSPLRPEHRDVFACSLGDNPISASGHIAMMAVVQPFLSGAISKTVNMPADATVDDVEQLFIDAWRLGLKAVAIYRDNSKVAQPLSIGKESVAEQQTDLDLGSAAGRQTDLNSNGAAGRQTNSGLSSAVAPQPVSDSGEPVRRRLPKSRVSRTFEFRVADCKGFVTVGQYPDGRPGEIFVTVSKQGSTLAGIMDAFAISVSHGLQYGVPLASYVEAYVGVRFEPAGITDDPDIRIATSLMDYLFRKLAVMYLSEQERAALGIYTTAERTQPTLPGVEEQATPTSQGHDVAPDPPSRRSPTRSATQLSLHTTNMPADTVTLPNTGVAAAPFCMVCGVPMRRAGSCFVCAECGATSGCS